MQTDINELEVNGIKYVKKGSQQELCDKVDGMKFVIVRTYSAGVFMGYLAERNGKEVVMLGARRLWYWSGAASLSQLAMEGTSKPKECKFPIAMDRVELTEAIEIIDVTKEAKKSLESVAVWEA